MQFFRAVHSYLKPARLVRRCVSTGGEVLRCTSSTGAKMTSRPYDVVVFGSTGLAGKYVSEELHRIQKTGHHELKWAAAGRDKEKLQRVLKDAGLENVDVIVADVNDHDSLEDMCSRASVLINTVGPYQVHGEPVVKACISQKTNYVDITGEQYFMETVAMRYDEQARDSGVYVVSACGFDCIPNDLGAHLLQKSFSGDLAHVESHMSVSKTTPLNIGTWDSFVRIIHNHWKLKSLLQQLSHPPLPLPTHKPPARRSIFYSDVLKRWSTAFPGPDEDIAYKSMRYRMKHGGTKPFHFSAYIGLPSFLEAFLIACSFWLLMPLVMTNLGVKLLVKFPGLFSGGTARATGPTKKELEGVSFSVYLKGVGYARGAAGTSKNPDSKLTVKISSDYDPGYTATTTMLVQSAMCLLNEKDKLPPCGGVYTPSVAFGNTRLLQNLEDTGKMKFEVVPEGY